jgi:hypothetical protein
VLKSVVDIYYLPEMNFSVQMTFQFTRVLYTSRIEKKCNCFQDFAKRQKSAEFHDRKLFNTKIAESGRFKVVQENVCTKIQLCTRQGDQMSF